jgi:hypothetical protein
MKYCLGLSTKNSKMDVERGRIKVTLKELALSYVARGWYVHPLMPRSKRPLLKDWPNLASNAEATVTEWWTKWPDANIGIACGPSKLVVLDIDHGLEATFKWADWCVRNHLTPTTMD